MGKFDKKKFLTSQQRLVRKQGSTKGLMWYLDTWINSVVAQTHRDNDLKRRPEDVTIVKYGDREACQHVLVTYADRCG